MGDILDLNEANYESEVLKSDKTVLIDFWAPWCGPCKMQTPILEKLAGDGSISVEIRKVNTDESPSIAQGLGIVSIPTLILFRAGEEVERMVGVQPEAVLRDKLKQYS